MSILEKVYYEESNNIESIEKFKLRYPKSIYINEAKYEEKLLWTKDYYPKLKNEWDRIFGQTTGHNTRYS